MASYQDALSLVVGTGLVSHWIFKRTETSEPVYAGALLIGTPACLVPLIKQHFSSTISAFIWTMSLYWTTLATSIVVYRLSPWHPLGKYPGPMLHRISKLRMAFIAWGGKQHIHYTELHERYGDVVRIGPNELSIRDARAIQPLIGVNGLPKGPYWEGRMPPNQIQPMIAIRSKQEHARRRRPWARAFNSTTLRDYEPIINNRTLQLLKHLSNQRGTVDLAGCISHWSYDFANDLSFGGGSEMMRDGDTQGLWHLLDSGQKSAIVMSHVPWLGNLLLKYPTRFGEDLTAFRAYARQQGTTRKTKGSHTKDLFYHLSDEGGLYPSPPTVAEVVSDAALAIIAGSDTTSSALANLFFFIMTNSATYKRLQAEVDSLGDDVMNYARHPHLPYLNAVINESLRLYPPVLSGIQRCAPAGEGMKTVGPILLPEGTNAILPFYTIHRDPRYFSPCPDSFIPERWLSREQQLELEPAIFRDEKSVHLEHDAFIPFSTGPMNCVGKNLAVMEMRMMVCLMLKTFDMQLEKGYDTRVWHDQVQDYFITVRGKLPVVLTARDSSGSIHT
ncbi:hypothetical protein AX16_010177 [Volvariella volvacea WC 439]|nr:hypothetical protein AX16_010177 [Volvariella volvacea WC 439]